MDVTVQIVISFSTRTSTHWKNTIQRKGRDQNRGVFVSSIYIFVVYDDGLQAVTGTSSIYRKLNTHIVLLQTRNKNKKQQQHTKITKNNSSQKIGKKRIRYRPSTES